MAPSDKEPSSVPKISSIQPPSTLFYSVAWNSHLTRLRNQPVSSRYIDSLKDRSHVCKCTKDMLIASEAPFPCRLECMISIIPTGGGDGVEHDAVPFRVP
jgi:hypothetical protein